MNSFHFLENEATADVAFLAYGDNKSEMFRNSCLALTETMVDINSVEKKVKYKNTIKAEDIKGLLYDLLENIIFVFETEDLLFNTFSINLDEKKIEVVWEGLGELYNPSKHQIKTHIKAITFFGMEFTNNYVKVTLDL